MVHVWVIGDNTVEPDETYTLILSNPTAANNGTAAIIGTNPAATSIINDDSAAITVTESGGSTDVTEGGATDTFTVVLGSAPTSDVTIALTGTQVTPDLTPLTFTTANWNTPQTVTVTAIDDAVLESSPHSGSVAFAVNSADAIYNGFALSPVSVNITDNEQAFSITSNTPSGAEGNSGTTQRTFTITRTGATGNAGTVDVSIAGTVDGADYANPHVSEPAISYSGSTISFPAGEVTATFVIDVVGDNTVEPDETLTLTLLNPTAASSGTAAINGTNPAATSIINDDSAAITVTESGGSTDVTEGGATDTFTVVLTSQPTNDVTIALTGTQVTPDLTPLTFTTANWNQAQTVTVTAIDDAVAEGAHTGSVAFAVSSADAIYNGFALSPVNVNITDNDSASVQIDTSAGLTTTEAGGTTTINIVLNSQPTADVTVSLSSANLNEVTVSPAIVFTSANWNQPQAMTLTGVDDTLDDGDTLTTITVSVSSSDSNYQNPSYAALDVTNTDDDSAGINVSPIVLNMTETSAPQSYTLSIATTPSAPFTLAILFDATQVTVNGSSTSPVLLTFSSSGSANVTVDALDNPAVNSDRMTTIAHVISASGAPEYPTSLIVGGVTVNIGDAPPPPPSPTCESENFDETGVVRTGIPNAIAYAINCRVLYYNGAATTWLGGPLYSEANLGIAGLLDLGVEQAVDIFSPPGLTYFNDGAVFCLRGEGTLIWLAASGIPRHAEIIGSYTVPDFAGFTCATLFEPGTLILVSENPLG
ncbi:MAG: hypothetical protein U0670_08760 [Anaerolineae bacterium]